MVKIRTQWEGTLLAEHEVDRWDMRVEFDETIEHSARHYGDPTGITVDAVDGDMVLASYTFA